MMKNYSKSYLFKISIFLMFTFISFEKLSAQELFVGSGAEFYLKANTNFTTSNTVVTKDPMGNFTVEAGNNWGSDSEYVDGEIIAKGSGDTKIPVGNNGVYAPVVATHTSDVVASYINGSPTAGANGVDVDAVTDVEYWKLTGNAIITLPWNDNSNITDLVNNNGGNLNAVAVVGLDNGTWNLVNATQTNTVTGDLLNGDVTSDINDELNLNNFTEFTFGIDHQVVLSINELFLTNGIQILSNPIKNFESTIRFQVENDMQNLNIILYDITGRNLGSYNQINTFGRIGSIPKPDLKSGLYFIKFDFEGKQGVKKIIIE